MRTNDPQNDSLDELIENFLDCHRRGEQPVVEDYAQRHPNHAESIRSLFPTLLAMESAASNSEDGDRSTLQVRCPHCHNQLDIIDDVSLSDLTCPSCGSHFSLIGDDTVTAPNDATRSIGHFELLEQIGIGHFGSVWKAHDAELDRIVAVKIPRKGRLDPEESEQFLREARAAAQFRHPNIVPVHEVGRHDETVFIVTDYVEGANLREWLTGQRLTIREAVLLVTKIAEALEHAHDSGVIHRDLKPGNIMLDGSGEPHLTDFGLARRETGEITMTVDGRILGTPAYMSPEQAQGKGHEADARSDIYSLGVVLFELLTGELPFRGETRMLIVQIINDEPPRPRHLNNQVPRDVETICLKCLEKDPERRYKTAGELAVELKRYLAGEPIRARPVSRVERGWRWALRNPRAAVLGSSLVFVLVGAAVGSTVAAVVINRARSEAIRQQGEAVAARADSDRAAQRAKVAEAQAKDDARRATIEAEKAIEVADFLANMFEESAPLEMGGRRYGSTQILNEAANSSARQILDRGAERVRVELANQPLVQASLMDTIGRVYLGLGLTDTAAELADQAYKTRLQHLPRHSLDVAESLHSLGHVLVDQLRFVQSADRFEEALEIRRSVLGDDHELVDRTRASLATVLTSFRPHRSSRDSERAEQLWRATVTWRRDHLGPTHRDTALAELRLANTLMIRPSYEKERHQSMERRNAEAVSLQASAMKSLSKDVATAPLVTAITQAQRSDAMLRLGNSSAAVQAINASMDALREVVDEDHPTLYMTKAIAVTVLARAARLDEAEELYRELMSVVRRRQVTMPFRFARNMQSVGVSLLSQDRTRGEALYRDTYTLAKRAIERDLAARSDGLLDAEGFVEAALAWGSVLHRNEDWEAAESLYQEVLSLMPPDFDGGFETMRVTLCLGEVVWAQGRLTDAEDMFRTAFELAEDCDIPEYGSDRKQWKSHILVDLAKTLADQHKRDESVAMCKQVVALRCTQWMFKAEDLMVQLGEPPSDHPAVRLPDPPFRVPPGIPLSPPP